MLTFNLNYVLIYICNLLLCRSKLQTNKQTRYCFRFAGITSAVARVHQWNLTCSFTPLSPTSLWNSNPVALLDGIHKLGKYETLIGVICITFLCHSFYEEKFYFLFYHVFFYVVGITVYLYLILELYLIIFYVLHKNIRDIS